MRTIFNLIHRDFKNIFHHRYIWITLLAFCLIPASYALLNIRASWNPYGQANTRRLPIAVVNNDQGSNFHGKTINVGHQIARELKRNHQINWVITNNWQANNGLDQGNYYALIEIPENFSDRLTTLASTSPERANVIYKSNEKLNPAATKISGQAGTNLTQQIRSSFTKIAGHEALKEMNRLGGRLNTKEAKILQIRTSLVEATKTIKQAQSYLKKTADGSQKGRDYLTAVHQNIPKVTAQINRLEGNIRHEKSLNESTRQTISHAENTLSSNLSDLSHQQTRFQTLIDHLIREKAKPEYNQRLLLQELNQIMISRINSSLAALDILNNWLPNNQTTSLIKALAAAKSNLKKQQRLIHQVNRISKSQASAVSKQQALIHRLATLNLKLSTLVESATNQFNTSLDGNLNRISDTINDQLDTRSSVIQSFHSLVPMLEALNQAGKETANLSTNQIKRIQKRLGRIQSSLNQLEHQSHFLNRKNLDKLIVLLQSNPKTADFLASPIQLKSTELYKLGLFGYGVTPFYSTLSIWIGALLLTVILKWRYISSKDQRLQPNQPQNYLGKLLLYVTLTFLQTTITLIGEIGLFGIQPANTVAMLAIAYWTTFIFTASLFTLVFLFGNVGKLVGVLLMIIQIFGTGGLYPLETISHSIAFLASYLPFTYAIQGYREAMAGPDWTIFGHDMLMLLGFLIVILLLTPLKPLLKKPIGLLENGMKKSGL